MTDNEIMKSLDACDNCFCENCSYKPKLIYCREELCKDALGLINRQKEEIERLQETIDSICIFVKETAVNRGSPIKTLKSEAIKEFAERLKNVSERDLTYSCPEIVTTEDIDRLVKEMTEVQG